MKIILISKSANKLKDYHKIDSITVGLMQ